MKNDLFEKFQAFVKEKYGYDLVECEEGISLTFENIFGYDFVGREEL